MLPGATVHINIHTNSVLQPNYIHNSTAALPLNYNVSDEQEFKGSGKACKIITIICYVLIISVFIWSFVNAFVKASTYKNYRFWLLIAGAIIYPFFMLAFFLLVFTIYKAFKSQFIYASGGLTHLVLLGIAAIILIRCKFPFAFIPAGVILLMIDIGLLVTYYTSTLSSLLFNISIEKLYSVKLDLLKGLMKRFLITSTGIYFGVASIGINLMNMLDSETKSTRYGPDSYLLGTTIAGGVVVYLTLFVVAIIGTLEPVLLGILLFVNKKKQNENTNNNNTHVKGTTHKKVRGISEENVEKSLKQMNTNKILNNFYGVSMYQFVYRYGTVTIINLKHRILFITKALIEQFEKSGFPLSLFRTTAGLIYSLFYDVSIQEATNMCMPAFYHGGYLSLVNGHGLMSFTSMNNFLATINITGSVAVFWLVKIFSSIETHQNEWILFGVVLLLLFISTFTIFGMVNALIQGYSQALICLYIEDPETVLEDERYAARLKKCMKKKCHMDQIK
eukprot:GAHX01001033.1.p1 GENE.GAHX01001033.1~~GAHX01001033.1.p1  ORF type:complete len:505 (-),score=75.86 GAHX01001033.1:49-1563(-)